MPRVIVDGSKNEFEVSPSTPVLLQGIAAGIELPNGCLAGLCGTCRATILEGQYRMGIAPGITSRSRENGEVLLCQTFADSNLRIQLIDAAISSAEHILQLISVSYPAADVAVLELRPQDQDFRFLPGQFIQLRLKDGTRRNYSLASIANESGAIQLHVRLVQEGRFSQRLFGAPTIQPGMKLRIAGPFGNFTLRPNTGPRVFLATGTGYAPIRAMLQEIARQQVKSSVIFYWGGKIDQDLYAMAEARALLEQVGGRFVPVLSRSAEILPGGRRGWVQDAVVEDFAELRSAQVYACGNAQMVSAAREVLCKKRQLKEENFFADPFLPS